MRFHIRLQPDGDRLVMGVEGRLDDATGEELVRVGRSFLRDNEFAVFEFDLEDVALMDSRGLVQLLAAIGEIRRAGRDAYFVRPSIHAREVLDAAGVTDLLQES